MKARFSGFVGLLLAVLLGSVLALSLAAQDAPKKAKAVNYQGTVQKKDASMITIDDKKIPKQVRYDASTKFMVGNSEKSSAGSADKVQLGNYISCAGSVDAKTIMTATSCVYRDAK